MDSLKTIEKLPIEEQIKMKMEIINSFEMAMDIPSIYLPETYSNKYFFISYSQKDFKKVYLDLFRLGQQDIHYWYDRGNPGGKDWPDVVKRNIAPFQCKGVIFYISENSLTSLSVDNEMKIIKDLGKPYIPITLPFEKDYVYKGENVKGKEYPVSVMIDILFENGKIDKKKANRLHKYFSDKTLYLHLNMPDVSKAEKINLAIPAVPLLVGKCLKDELIIETINDSTVDQITKADFFELLVYLKMNTDKKYLVTFYTSCLSNCKNLKIVELPSSFTIKTIGMFAFANDTNFVEFKGKKRIQADLLDGAFYGCSSLKSEICFENEKLIGNRVLYGCSQVPFVVVHKNPTRIGDFAFAGCSSMFGIFLNKTVTSIGESAFMDCSSLGSVEFGEGLVGIERRTFSGCHSLGELFLPDTVTFIGDDAFCDCRSLSHISIGSNIEYIGTGVFYGCSSLIFNKVDNVKYLGKMKDPYVVACGSISKNKTVHIVDTCRIILDEAFSDCLMEQNVSLLNCVSIGRKSFHNVAELKNLQMGKNLTHIGDGAFSGCGDLRQVYFLSSKLKYLPDYLFLGCGSLKNVKFTSENKIETIGKGTFESCRSLCSFDVPDKVSKIGECAFKNCSSLNDIKLPNGLQSIDYFAFESCYSLRTLVLPRFLEMMSYGAFKGCCELEEITFAGTKLQARLLMQDDLDFDINNQKEADSRIFNNFVSVKVIHCLDGDILKGKKE